MSYRPCGMLETDFLISLFWGQQWSESHHEYKRIGLSLLQQVVMVQKPAGAGGSGIKQKQSCINLHLLLLFDKKKNECVHRILIISDQYATFPSEPDTHTCTNTHPYARILPHFSDQLSTNIVRFGEISSFIQQMWGRGAAGSPSLLHSHVTH